MKKIYSSGTLGTLNFKRCTKCGLVFSDTMYQMSDEEWQKHNKFYHSYWFNNTRNSLEHNPPYLQQALFFKILQKNNLIKNDNWLDYASGVGTLSRLLKEYFNLNKYSNATPDALISAFESASKTELDSFFDSWISGKVVIR